MALAVGQFDALTVKLLEAQSEIQQSQEKNRGLEAEVQECRGNIHRLDEKVKALPRPYADPMFRSVNSIFERHHSNMELSRLNRDLGRKERAVANLKDRIEELRSTIRESEKRGDAVKELEERYTKSQAVVEEERVTVKDLEDRLDKAKREADFQKRVIAIFEDLLNGLKEGRKDLILNGEPVEVTADIVAQTMKKELRSNEEINIVIERQRLELGRAIQQLENQERENKIIKDELAIAIEELSKTKETLRRQINTLKGAAIGAGSGAGAAILVDFLIIPLSIPVALGFVGGGAVIGAIIGDNS
jgi:hypothetical protein